jgi:hypothetical protein
MKAYQVTESGEGQACVVFAVSGAPARVAGASELGTDWDGIESCRRAPEFDDYAPGPVQQRALFDAGWWFECGHCGHRVSQGEEHDDRHDDEGNDADPADFGFVERGRRVFCCLACLAKEDAEKTASEERQAAVIEAAALRWPMATNIAAWGSELRAVFSLPGLLGTVQWAIGKPEVLIEKRDEDAFRRLYGGTP